VDDRIVTALFLNSPQSNEMLAAVKPEWAEKTDVDTSEKLSMLNVRCSLADVFPWKEELSPGIDHLEFCKSFFLQPDLFIRIRPGFVETVLLKLDEIGVKYEFISPYTARLPNSFKADQYFELDKEIVIQDLNSQRIASFLPFIDKERVCVWDSCAASGGKSLMAYDVNPNIDLTVSDKRESILVNLKKRFQQAGIKSYKSFVTDLTTNQQPVGTGNFDLIIADVPCTGSGTWGRTPEQLFYFDKSKIDEYASLQRKIITNVIPLLKPGGYFLYITCSVFKKENEGNISYIKESFHLDLAKMEILTGYYKKADTLFAALFRRPL
jgi:16S rRNA (cytosine967-C5)-methyltransferase